MQTILVKHTGVFAEMTRDPCPNLIWRLLSPLKSGLAVEEGPVLRCATFCCSSVRAELDQKTELAENCD